MLRLMPVASIVFGLGLTFCCGLFIGLAFANLDEWGRRYQAESALVAPVLAADPRFGDVRSRKSSDGSVFLSGTVPTPADWDRLHAQLVRAVGEPRADRLMTGVHVLERQPEEAR